MCVRACVCDLYLYLYMRVCIELILWCYSVAYVSRSGGMSNELNNIIIRNTNGVHEGVAIGGDRYDHKLLTHSVLLIP